MDVLRKILLTKKVKGERFFHDPLYDRIEYDPSYGMWNTSNPQRAYMRYARPIRTTCEKWDSITNRYQTMCVEEYRSYYRPSEFYDHYYSPHEMNSKTKEDIYALISYITEQMTIMFSMDPLMYKSQLLILKNMLDGTSFMDSLHKFVRETKYNIPKSIPLDISIKKFENSQRNVDFHETWNTVDIFHMIIPRKRTYFVDPEAMTCVCKEFKKTKTCNHVFECITRRVLFCFYENMSLTIDITKIVMKFLR